MELSSFIEETLVSICKGIDNAKIRYDAEYNNAPIAPFSIDGKSVLYEQKSTIEFEIAVAVTEKKSGKGEGKAGISVLSVSANSEKIHEHSNINKIKFSVPLVIPPFLGGLKSRGYAAILSFCIGVMPPIPILGRSLLYVQSHLVA